LLWGEDDAAGHALVAVAIRQGGWRLVEDSPAAPSGGRVMHLALFAGGRTAVHFFNLYGPPDKSAAARAEFLALVVGALAAADSFGSVPAVILGDLNQDPLPDEVGVLLHLGGWRDVGAPAGLPTCFGAGSRVGSCVDVALVNPPAGRMLAAFKVDHGTAIPTHAMLRLSLEVGAPPWFPARLRAADLSGAAAPGWDAEAAVPRLRRRWASEWEAALVSGDFDSAGEGLAAGVAEFLTASLR
jgi:hypothetical protein